MRDLVSHLMVCIALVSINGCGCLSRNAESEHSSAVRITEHVTMTTVTPRFEIRPMTEIRRGITDSSDMIENDYAVSSVRINPDGSYDHSLQSKPQIIADSLEVPVVSRDSSFVSNDVELRYVDKPVKGWRLALMEFGAISIAAAILLIAIKISKIFNHTNNN